MADILSGMLTLFTQQKKMRTFSSNYKLFQQNFYYRNVIDEFRCVLKLEIPKNSLHTLSTHLSAPLNCNYLITAKQNEKYFRYSAIRTQNIEEKNFVNFYKTQKRKRTHQAHTSTSSVHAQRRQIYFFFSLKKSP